MKMMESFEQSKKVNSFFGICIRKYVHNATHVPAGGEIKQKVEKVKLLRKFDYIRFDFTSPFIWQEHYHANAIIKISKEFETGV